MKYFLLLTGLSLSLNLGYAAESILAPASQAMPLENTGGAARAKAMGSAFVGVADDSSALLWNPAGLGFLRVSEISLHHNTWLTEIIQETVSLVYPWGDLGGLGIALNYINYGNFEGRDISGLKSQDYTANQIGITLGWGKNFGNRFSGGVSLKAAQQILADRSYFSLAGDLGILWLPSRSLKLGMAYANLGAPVSGNLKASGLRLGVSTPVRLDKTQRFLLAASTQLEPQGVNRIQFGAEDVLYSVYAVRLGYLLNLAETQIQGLTGLSAGLGYVHQSFLFDYAYLPFGDLGTSHRVSMGYQFSTDEVTRGNVSDDSLMEKTPFTLGQELEKQGLLNEAVKAYRQAVEADPKDPRVWRHLGNVNFKLNNKKETIRCFEEVLRLDPKDTRLKTWLDKYKALTNSLFPKH